MKLNLTKLLSSRLLMFIMLGWVSMSMSSCLFNIYSPSTTLSMTGTTSYCQGATATPNTLNYDQCTLGGGIFDDGVPYTAQWYYNTTGGTSIPGSTALGAPISNISPAGGPGSESYTPLTSTVGTFYYFCYFTWATTGTCTSDFTSNTQTITITPPPAALTGTATVCVGSTTTLSTTSTGGAWSTSAGGIATVTGGVVMGVSPGTATIAYTTAGCAATRVVTVYATPAAITPAGTVNLCQGATASLASTTAGGNWSSSNAGVATINTSGVVTGTGGGTATITYAIPATGCYTTKLVSVNPVPGAITGTTQVCPGATTTLSNPSPGGTWSSSTPAVATVNATTGVVGGITTGTAEITYTGCGFVTAVVSVHPNPAAITGPAYVCEGGATITWTSATPGGTWSSGAPAFATATTSGTYTGLITGVVLGTASITYTSPLTCITSRIVTINPAPTVISGSVPICVGQTLTVTNGTPGGTWSSAIPGIASVDAGGVVTGVTNGTTTISYVNDCSYAVVVVTINPLPAPIIGDSIICLGSTNALADITIGGTWSSNDPSIASVLLTSGLVTGNATGAAVITYTMPGGCFITETVTVVPMPSDITGTATVCPNATTNLANTTPGGVWTSGANSIATIGATSGIVTGVSAGTAVITYTTPPGCKVYEIVLVNPNPEPIVGDVIYCAKDIDTLFNPTPGGTWSSTTPSIATINAAGIVTVLSGGTAVIRYTLPTGCFTSKSFSVNPAPGPTVSYLAATNTFYTESGYVSYQWYDAIQGLIPGATSISTAAVYFGFYWVVVTDGNGCMSESAHHPYNASIGFGDVSSAGYRIYPNPTSEMVHIEAPVNVRATITSVDGKVLIDRPNAKDISIKDLADGLYLVTLYDQEGIQISVTKLIKQ